MANKTLLNSVNEIFKRVGMIAGDAGALTSLTDSARQNAIDVAIQVINEGIDEVYTTSSTPLPNEQAESTITLATSTRAYSLATDLVQLRFPLIDKTSGMHMGEYPGGYNQILVDDPRQEFAGLPVWAAIRPTDGKLFTSAAPSSAENGKVYTYQYDKNTALSVAADTVPFNDEVFRAMVPLWAKLWKRDQRGEFDQGLFAADLGRACRLLTQLEVRDSWSPR